MKLMDMIYDGRIYPGEQVVSREPEYRETNREIGTMMDKLEIRLSKEDYEDVEKVCDLYAVLQDLQCRAFFDYGLSMGVRLTREAYECPYIRNVEVKMETAEE